MMDNYALKLAKANRYTTSSRTPKSHPTKSLVHYDASNKENILNSSNLDRTRTRLEEKRNYPNSSSSLERRNKGTLHMYNGSTISPPSNNIYSSPRYAEINLLQENFKTAGIAKYNNYLENSSKKENKGISGDSQKLLKKSKQESDSKNRLKENHPSGLGNFEERASEKVTIYTRLLSTMKPSTPKSRDLSSQKHSTTNPQRASIDLLGLGNQARKPYVNGPTVCGRLDKKTEAPKKKETIGGASGSLKSSSHDENRLSQKSSKEELYFKQEKPLRREKFTFPKKLSIDIQEPLQTEGSDSYKTASHSASNHQSRSIPKVYESFSSLKKGLNKNGYLAKSNAIEGGLSNNYIRNSRENSCKDLKSVFKSSTPKALSNQNPEIKKLFASSKNLMIAGESQESSACKEGLKKESNSSSYKNLLKAGSLKTNTALTKPTSDQRKRPLSLTKNPKKKDIFLVDKTNEEDHAEVRTQGSVSTKNLKDFITQVNPGFGGIPTKKPQQKKLEIEIPQDNEEVAAVPKKQYSQSAKNATSKKIAFNGLVSPSSRPQRAPQPTAKHFGSSHEEKLSNYNRLRRPNNIRNIALKTEEEEQGSYSEFRSDLMIEENHTATPTYYMTSIQKYIMGPEADDEYFEKIYKEHFLQTFQAVNFCKYLKNVDPMDLDQKKVYLPRRDGYKDKKTIVFDLDETLIHCNENTSMPCDVILPIKFPNGDIIEAGINIRPYTMECLEELSKYFEIIVFTASHGCYANVALDYLDPENKYFHHRLFREHCITTEEGLYIKDLRILANRDLKDVVIVDNAVYSFGYQLENGIPIIPFYFNKKDQELKSLVSYLKNLYYARDVREVNRKTFKLSLYADIESQEELLSRIF